MKYIISNEKHPMHGMIFNGHAVEIDHERRIWNDDSEGQSYSAMDCIQKEGFTVQELIDQLQKVDDKTQLIRIAVYTEFEVYPVAYIPYNGSHNQAWHEYRLFARLPDGMGTRQRKQK